MSTSEALTKLCASLTLSYDQSGGSVDADSLVSFYRPTNNMEYLASRGTLSEKRYNETLIPYYLPGIVLSFFTLCGVIWCIFFILRKKGLICLKLWKYLDSHSLSDQTKRRYYVVGAVLTMLGFASAITGIVFSAKSLNEVDQAYCQYYDVIQRIYHDRNDKNWMGLGSITFALENVQAALPTMKTSIDDNQPSLISSYTSLENKRDDLLNELDSIYSTYSVETVTTPAFKTPESPYNPPLLRGLGPTSSSTTSLGIFQQETVNTTAVMKSANDKVLDSTSTLASAYGTYSSNLQTFVAGMETMISWWTSFTLGNSGALEVSDSWSGHKGVSKATLGFFVVACVMNVLFFVLKGFLYKEKISHENRVYYAWTFLGFTMTISYAVLLAFVFPNLIKTVEVCHLVSVSIHNKEAFDATFKHYAGQNTESVNFLSTCLHESGDLIKKYETNDLFDSWETLRTNSKIAIDLKSVPSTTATDLISIVKEYLYFRTMIDESDKTRSVSISKKLVELNQLTNFLHSESFQSSSAKCRVTADTWQFTGDQCSGYQNIPVTGYEATTSFGKPTCLNLLDISTQSVNDRYVSYRFLGCDTMSLRDFPENSLSANIIRYVDSFAQHVNSVQTVLTNLVSSLNSLNSNQVSDFFSEIDKIATPVENIVLSTQGMSDIIFPSGEFPLKGRLNCAAIKDTALQLQYKVCDKLVSSTKSVLVLIITTYVLFLLQTYVYFRILLGSI